MGTSGTHAKQRYRDKAYDRIEITVKRGIRPIWKEAAAKNDKSLNEFIIDVVEEKINNAALDQKNPSD